MQKVKQQILDFVRLLFIQDPFDYSDRRVMAWTYLGLSLIGLFMIWTVFLQIRLYVFKIPSRWHTPEALMRAGITQSQTHLASPVMAEFALTPTKCCEGVIAIGATGSGKSSTIKRLMTEFLQGDVGCLWLAAKKDEPKTACKIMKAAGRTPKLFIPGKSRCNLLTYELSREAGSPSSMAEFLQKADEVMNGGSSGKEESFWRSARKETATHAIGIVSLAHRKNATFERVYDLLLSAPSSNEQLSSDSFRRGECCRMLDEASRNANTSQEQRLAAEAINYFTSLLPAASEKVYGATVMHLSAMLAPFVRGDMFDTVNCTTSDILPDDPLRGECVVMCNPVVENPGNQLVQILFSMLTIEATLRRPVTTDMPIVAVVRDEWQLVGNAKFDSLAQTIARQQKLACFTAFQSLSVLHEACSEPMRAKHQAASLLGNHVTKLFFANTDHTTMEVFSELCGKQWRPISGGGQQPHEQQDMLGVDGNFNMNFHQQLTPRKLGSALVGLRTGGEENGFIVEGYVHTSGKKFNGLSFKKFQMEQDLS